MDCTGLQWVRSLDPPMIQTVQITPSLPREHESIHRDRPIPIARIRPATPAALRCAIHGASSLSIAPRTPGSQLSATAQERNFAAKRRGLSLWKWLLSRRHPRRRASGEPPPELASLSYALGMYWNRRIWFGPISGFTGEIAWENVVTRIRRDRLGYPCNNL